ncbi:MAG: hypothetical protein Q9207_005455 [Kuettlingeria erythrocarpa]
MHFHIECPEFNQHLKRSFSGFFDGRDSDSLQPSKRHEQLPPTLLTPRYSLDKLPPPSCPQEAPLTPPESSRSLRKRKFEDNHSALNTPTKRRIGDWLRSTRPQISDPDAQRPLLDVLQEMSQGAGAGSSTSGRNARSVTSHPDYRSTLRNNGVYIDHTGAKIPQELREFLDSSILKQQSDPLTPDAIAEAVKTAIEIADSPESNIYDLNGTAMIPIKRSDVGRGGNTPWYTDTLPKTEAYGIPLAQPKPDVHCGYLTGQRSTWTIEENAVIDHQQAKKITQPAKGNCFPFFVFEMKSEAMSGTLWQAENQAAGSGACCVNIKRWLFREAHGNEDQPVIDSVAFSACVTHREVVFHVHHYSAAEKRFYMSSFGAFQTVREVEGCNNIVSNIFKHGLGTRQDKTREELKLLYPFPAHWKKARSASLMESQNTAADEDEPSNKSQRTDEGV